MRLVRVIIECTECSYVRGVCNNEKELLKALNEGQIHSLKTEHTVKTTKYFEVTEYEVYNGSKVDIYDSDPYPGG